MTEPAETPETPAEAERPAAEEEAPPTRGQLEALERRIVSLEQVQQGDSAAVPSVFNITQEGDVENVYVEAPETPETEEGEEEEEEGEGLSVIGRVIKRVKGTHWLLGLVDSGGGFLSGGRRLTAERTAKGTYLVKLKKARRIKGAFAFPQTEGVIASWSVVFTEPEEEPRIVVRLKVAKTGEDFDGLFFIGIAA